MQGVHILETGNVEVAAVTCVVGKVQTEAPVYSQDEEIEVVAQADACAGGQLLKEIAGTELPT